MPPGRKRGNERHAREKLGGYARLQAAEFFARMPLVAKNMVMQLALEATGTTPTAHDELFMHTYVGELRGAARKEPKRRARPMTEMQLPAERNGKPRDAVSGVMRMPP